MSTPPLVSQEEAVAAIDRIAARRAAIDDANAWQLNDDPLDTLAYLRKFSAGIPPDVAAADVLDGLTLRVRLWWMGEEAELWLLERARRLGLPLRQFGPSLGITSRQGVHDRLRLAREKMQKVTGSPHSSMNPPPDQREHNAELAWLDQHRTELQTIASTAIAYRDLADEEALDWLLDVARDLRESVMSPGALQVLRFALAELGISVAVTALDPGHPLAQMLHRWSQLYASHPGRSTAVRSPPGG